jgi:hypothetical protein
MDQAMSGSSGQGVIVEASRRVVRAQEASERSANQLGKRIWWLNLWLLVFTIAIFALTAVLVWTSVRGVGDGRRQSTGAAPASRAEGAWMLWTEDKSVSLVGEVSVEWSPPVAFADRAACMAFLDTQVSKWHANPNEKQSATLAETGTEAEFRTRSSDSRDAVHSTKRAFCLPDTVDPRPKGGGR